MLSRSIALLCALMIVGAAHAKPPRAPWEVGEIDPAWSKVRPKRTITVLHKGDDVASGAKLWKAMRGLEPGDELAIGPGRFAIDARTALDVVGTARAPIWIRPTDPRKPPVITRSDSKQNVLNVGVDGPARFLALRGLVLTGGSSVVRLYDCEHVWIDRCEIHRGDHVGITANVKDTRFLHITRNHVHHFEHPKGTDEGMYLGANQGKARMSYSVIALNHVHHCAGTQGDGIEVKQGSHHNWIVGNLIHDTRYPALTIYGTGGEGINLVENNVCYRTGDACLQIQGEAIVRNNLLVGAKNNAALFSKDHQAKSRQLTVVHNTIVNEGVAVRLNDWSGREGMVLANNAIISTQGVALMVKGDGAGVTIAGNVVSGRVQGAKQGFSAGGGLADLTRLTIDGQQLDARPRKTARLHRVADRRWLVKTDLVGGKRRHLTAGAYAPGAKATLPKGLPDSASASGKAKR